MTTVLALLVIALGSLCWRLWTLQRAWQAQAGYWQRLLLESTTAHGETLKAHRESLDREEALLQIIEDMQRMSGHSDKVLAAMAHASRRLH